MIFFHKQQYIYNHGTLIAFVNFDTSVFSGLEGGCLINKHCYKNYLISFCKYTKGESITLL